MHPQVAAPEGQLSGWLDPLKRKGSKPVGGIPSLERQNPKSTEITTSGEKQQGCSLPEREGWRHKEPFKGPTHKLSFAATYPGLWQRWGQGGLVTPGDGSFGGEN